MLILSLRLDFIRPVISGIKKDNGATIELSDLKNADYDLVGVNKKSLVVTSTKSSDKFKMNLEIEFFYPLTCPWSDGGKMGSECDSF